MKPRTKQFLWARAHDMNALACLALAFLWIARGTKLGDRYWVGRIDALECWCGDGYFFFNRFLIQGPHPFWVSHGRDLGPAALVVATDGVTTRFYAAASCWIAIAITGVPLLISLGLAIWRLPGALPIFAQRIRDVFISRSRRERGLCVACGYDLRASPGRCPECGRVADQS